MENNDNSFMESRLLTFTGENGVERLYRIHMISTLVQVVKANLDIVISFACPCDESQHRRFAMHKIAKPFNYCIRLTFQPQQNSFIAISFLYTISHKGEETEWRSSISLSVSYYIIYICSSFRSQKKCPLPCYMQTSENVYMIAFAVHAACADGN